MNYTPLIELVIRPEFLKLKAKISLKIILKYLQDMHNYNK